VRQTQYEYLWVLTATCAQTGGAVGLVAPNLDAGVVNAFLAQFARELPGDVHAVLVWDRAGFHKAGALVIPADVTIRFLPPYAPELNPVERLWHYLRSHFWSNRFYKDYAALLDAATTAWRAVCLTAALVRSICACSYLPDTRQELV
jgi:transposase